jgi:hypothetical protein
MCCPEKHRNQAHIQASAFTQRIATHLWYGTQEIMACKVSESSARADWGALVSLMHWASKKIRANWGIPGSLFRGV